MSFSYNLNDNDPKIQVISNLRLNLGDATEDKGAKPDGTNLQDDELYYFYEDEGNNVGRAVARGCEVLATNWAKAPRTMFGSLVDPRHITKNYQNQAKEFRQQHGYYEGQPKAFSVSMKQIDK